MFFKKDKSLVKTSEYGRVYALRITLDTGKVVHKVGMCHSERSVDRMMEVLRSFFNTYRYVPQCVLKRDKKILIPRLVEKYLHDRLDDLVYTFDKKFDGSTEFFQDLDEEAFLEYLDSFEYTELLQCTVMKEQDLLVITKALDKKKPTTSRLSNEEQIPF